MGFCPPRSAGSLRAAPTPWVGTIVTGGIAAVTAGFTPLDLLGELISIGTLLAFAVVCAGILVLRKVAPNARRPFRTPWVPVFPLPACCPAFT